MIDLLNISLQFGGKYLFKELNYKINSGDKISLVGANGTGKSSLLKIIAGELQPESGSVVKQKRISIGYLPQEHITHKGKSLLEEAKTALTHIASLQQKEKELLYELNTSSLEEEEHIDLVHQLGEVHYRLEELDSYSAEAKLEKILMGLGFAVNDLSRLTEEFSGGWQMRIALAKILISQNDLLLLDEPTNHLDFDSLQWLIGFLKNYKGALLIVSHDKHFINEVTSKTLEIYLNKFFSYNGNFDAYLKYKEERDKQTESQFILQQKKIKDTQRFIERFRYKASKAKQVQSRIKQLEKLDLIELPDSQEDLFIKFPDPPPSGKRNIELRGIRKAYGEKLVFENLNFTVERGEKIAFIGPNGAGKSTMAKIIAGEINFNAGERIPGHNVIISYYAQDVADELEPQLDIIETTENIAEDKTIGQLRSLLGSFLFHGDDVFKKVGVLSGGEKSRVALVKILLTQANFLILDEPTNHLDMNSKKVLQNALINFNGSLILVSHDIDFLTPIVNKVVDIRYGSIRLFEGSINYYLQKKKKRGKEIIL
jgi:ATP-binding cassette subfamily F protein 3